MLVVLSATFILVDLFVAIMQVTVSVKIMQLEVSTPFMQVKVSAANVWVTIFIETMHVEVCYNHAGSIFYSASEGIRHYIKFAFHHCSKHLSKIKILCG